MGKHHQNQRVVLALALGAALSECTAAAAQGVDLDWFKDQVRVLINEQRAVNGLPALQRVAALETVAQSYSETMMQATAGGPVYLSHIGPDGSTLARRVSATDYAWYTLGEDLAACAATPEQVVAGWMSSPEHRDNILNPDFGDDGIGIAAGPGTGSDGRLGPQVLWWTVVFAEGAANPDQPDAPPPPPAPSVSGYTALDGTPVSGAPFGSLILISGENLGLTGTIAFDGQPTSAVCWTPTSILAIVPLQRVYPDTGPVTLTMGDQTATGPSFTTEQPGDPAPVPPAAPNPLLGFAPPAWPPASSPGAGGSPSAPLPTIRELADGNQRPLGAVAREVLFFIQGSGFGTNPLYRSRVLFVTASGDPIDGAVWDWSDDSIAVFAPSVSGPAQVVVQVDADGAPVASNRVPLVIQ